MKSNKTFLERLLGLFPRHEPIRFFSGPMSTTEWFRRAVPRPTAKNFHVQLGVHVEEFREMLESLQVDDVAAPHLKALIIQVETVALGLKTGVIKVTGADWAEFFDSIIDQRVTGTGLVYMIDGNLAGAVDEVDGSNESKFVNGSPIWDANGKIAKGPDYRRANLLPYLPHAVTILAK